MKRLVLTAAFIMLVGACGEPSSSTIFASPTTSSAGATTVTTVAATTTTTTVAATTTTTLAPTTTTLAPTTTTTTTPPPAFLFLPDGFGVAQFGDAPAGVIATLTEILGAPSRDTGWVDEPLCPGPMNRFVDFGADLFDFQILFTNGDLFAAAGTEHFYSYQFHGATAVPVNPPQLTVGTTVAQLQALYPAVAFVENPFFAGTWDYQIVGPGFTGLFGNLSGTGAGDVVLSVQGGIHCGE